MSIVFGNAFKGVFACLHANTFNGAKIAIVTRSPYGCFGETCLVLFRVTIHAANIVTLAPVTVCNA